MSNIYLPVILDLQGVDKINPITRFHGKLIVAWQMGRELHVTDSSSTGHERVTYVVMSMTYQQESSTGHKRVTYVVMSMTYKQESSMGHERVTYVVMSMTGHGDRSRTHQVRDMNVSRT